MTQTRPSSAPPQPAPTQPEGGLGGLMIPADVLAMIQGGGLPGVGANEPSYIGIPEGTPTTPMGPNVAGPAMPGSLSPRYKMGDELAPARWTPERRARLQRDLAEAGLLDAYLPGVWDEASIDAYQSVLGLANINSTTADRVIEQYRSNPELRARDAARYSPKQYTVPDLDAIEQAVRKEVESTVGAANLSDDIYDELAMRLSSYYRDSVAQQQQMDREQFDRDQQAAAGTTPDAPPVVEQMDPMAKFRSDLEERFAASIERSEEQEVGRMNRGLFEQSQNVIRSMIGRG